ncbi:hypothetical protein [Nitrincola sp.]|uniref:hypothetical protein n=1 Tax=Nitrincola sp. TaxID=1926584 RepID=UPI003A92A07C
MMFADLVDEVDFRERLQALGAVLPAEADPQTCIRLVKAQHADRPLPGLDELIGELLANQGLLQPEVKLALQAYQTL